MPSASTVTCAPMSEPGSKRAQRLAVAAAPAVAGADADHATVRDEQLVGDVSGSTVTPSASASSASQRPTWESDAT